MIRKATVADIDSLIELRIMLLNEANKNIDNYDWDKYSKALKSFYYEGLSNGKVIAYLAEENYNYVAVSIMCFYNITPLMHNLEGKMALLTDMYTMPEYRNKGLGMDLLTTITQRAKELGYQKVILNATDSGRRLYERYGFNDINGEMAYKFNIEVKE